MTDPPVESAQATEREDRRVLEYGTQRRSRAGMGALAVAASMLLSGLGHYIVGERAAAKRWFLLSVGLFATTLLCGSVAPLVPICLALVPIGLIFQIFLWVSAFRAARRSDHAPFKSPLVRYLVAALLLFVALFLIPAKYIAYPWQRYVVEAFVMPTASMSPTIVPNDRFLVHKLRGFKRFDIVLIQPGDPRAPTDVYAKRVVGFPGETIELAPAGVLVNGKLANAPPGITYVSTMANGSALRFAGGRLANGIAGNPITLGDDEYFFLGDNSPISGDSRYWDWSVDGHQPGTLPRSRIKGVATWIYFPISRWRKLY